MLRAEPDLETGFMALMLRLHASLLAGMPGTVFLGVMGLLFVAALVSGAVVYGPFMRNLPFGTVRRDRAIRLRWLDLHNLLGIVTLVWALVVALTAARALPWYVTALLVSQPPHFGDYGGLPLKILWAALDVVTILVLVSGLYLWGKRRNPLVEDRARTVAVDTPAGAAERGGPA